MAMSKFWQKTWERLDAIEEAIKAFSVSEGHLSVELVSEPTVTKDQLMGIKGVGDATADEILKLISDSGEEE